MAVATRATFDSLGLMASICQCLTTLRLKTPTKIQKLAIPSLLGSRCHHLIAAQTGTGKTFSYLLPVMQALKLGEIKAGRILTQANAPRAIVVVPSRELSEQLNLTLRNFKHTVLFRAFSLHSGITPSVAHKELGEGHDIVIGTPEKLRRAKRDHLLSFSQLEEVVFDESDTLVDAGFAGTIREYIDEARNRARFVFVGATHPKQLETLLREKFDFAEKRSLPFLKRIIDEETHLNLRNIHHEMIKLTTFDKNPQLLATLREHSQKVRKGGCLVFCNTIDCANATEYSLKENGYITAVLHGEVPSEKRARNVEEFRNGKVEVLVCTDLASRGLDFPNVGLIVQYDFPTSTSDYLHRAGRTGRGGKRGTSVSLFRNRDQRLVTELQQSFASNKPLQIEKSAYSLKNKEDFRK